MHGRYVTDILKVYMKKFIAELFERKNTHTHTHCREFTVSLACSQFLVGVGFSCHISYHIVIYLYVNFSRLITSFGEERIFFCHCLLVIMWSLFRKVFLPLGAWDRLCYLIVALPWPSIGLFCIKLCHSDKKIV